METKQIRLLFVLLCLGLGAYFLPSIPKDLRRTLSKAIPNRYSTACQLETATPSYMPHALGGARPQIRSASNCEPNCSWNSFQDNVDFKRKVPYTHPFAIDDTEELKQLNDTMLCSPQLFGYSVEAGNQVFPPYQYPTCSSLIPSPQPHIHINQEAGSFTMECPEGIKGTYLLQPEGLISNGQYYFHELDWKVRTYPGKPVSMQGSEFVYAACGGQFTQAQYIPTKNETAYEQVKATMRDLGLKHKPLSIVFLSIDSFSRRHFFRKLPQTLSTLNSLNAQESGYRVFDFKLHNVLGATSTENMVPMFGNSPFLEVPQPPYRDLLGPGALWNIFKSKGYMTLMGYENCDYHFPAALGKVVDVDHFARNFYCAASKFLNVKMSKEGQVQRCIGPHMSHYYVLNYTQAFAQAYQDANQFVYLHLNAAHEESGQHAATLDADLDLFVREYLGKMRESHDVVLILQGDHGMRYGNWYKDIEAYQENKLPALFMVASEGLLDRIPNSYDSLWHNTQRLVSKRDLRATLLSLTELPYNTIYPVHSDPYLSRDYSLLTEKVSDLRTCDMVEIPPWYCSCLDLKEVDSDVLSAQSDPQLYELLTTVAVETIALINKEVFAPTKLTQGLCQKLTFRTILKAYGLKLGPKMEQIQLEFGVNELSEARFEVYAILGTETGSHFMRLEREREPLTPLVYRGHQARLRVRTMQIIGVQRKDKYKGLCEVLSRGSGLRGELCVCNDLEIVKRDLPRLFEVSSDN